MPHRTQILYTADISMICFSLDIKPGSVVVEAGTGSGSLTHALARAIKPNGHVHTFDFHAERAAQAKSEFNSHGLGDIITSKHRDVVQNGFSDVIGEKEGEGEGERELDGKADALFLDLPAPWNCITNVAKTLKAGGRFCSFSPCIEQVQKTWYVYICMKRYEMKYSPTELYVGVFL